MPDTHDASPNSDDTYPGPNPQPDYIRLDLSRLDLSQFDPAKAAEIRELILKRAHLLEHAEAHDARANELHAQLRAMGLSDAEIEAAAEMTRMKQGAESGTQSKE